MSQWRTPEEKLAYFRAYGARYRRLCPDKIKKFKKDEREKRLLQENYRKLRKEADARESHRLTILDDEYDAGGFI